MGKLNLVTKACSIFLLWVAMAVALPAQTTPVSPPVPTATFTTLYSFAGPDGQDPLAGLVQAANGRLYGTTAEGGTNSNPSLCGSTCGTLFNITVQGTLTTLYNFCSRSNCVDGANPEASLIQATDGRLYGTTFLGGTNANSSCEFSGDCGTAFKITPSGTRTTLYDFCPQGNCSTGDFVVAPLVQGSDRDFYGTTEFGGSRDGGTVFKITSDGALITLYSFCSQSDCADGAEPSAGVIEGTDRNFYGTTSGGGAYSNNCVNGCGTVFKITPGGALTTLYTFCPQNNCTDGREPVAGLVEGFDGNFYGTTLAGGGNDDCCGTAFKITPSGTLTTLYDFCVGGYPSCPDGFWPRAALIQGTDGNFYGTTSQGGTIYNCDGYGGCGTIFSITPSGTLTMLYIFCSQNSCKDGAVPQAGLVQNTNGMFYGTAGSGANGDGTVFSLSVGLGPFVKTNPAAGKVGSSVGILGTDLTGVTDVTFNGTATAFRVVSSTFIEAKVPSGATTGTVQVQLPGGTLSSNVPFIVLP